MHQASVLSIRLPKRIPKEILLTSSVTFNTLPMVSLSQVGKSRCTGPCGLFCGIGLATAGWATGAGTAAFFTGGGGVGCDRTGGVAGFGTGGGVDLDVDAAKGAGEGDWPGVLVTLLDARAPCSLARRLRRIYIDLSVNIAIM